MDVSIYGKQNPKVDNMTQCTEDGCEYLREAKSKSKIPKWKQNPKVDDMTQWNTFSGTTCYFYPTDGISTVANQTFMQNCFKK